MAKRLPAYKLAQAEIKKYIEAHRLKPGDILPPEGLLAQEMGISRPSLREAVKALESLGILESRHGEGIYVKEFTFDSILENLPYSMMASESQVKDILYVRSNLEVAAIPDVFRKIQPENLRRLQDLVTVMQEKATRGESFGNEDREFHEEMYRCLNNNFLMQLISLFWRVFNGMDTVVNAKQYDQSSLISSAQDHADIAAMLLSKNESGLVAAYRKHYDSIFSRFG